MPLSTGTSKEARQGNIEKEIEAGRDPKQAVAIAYAKQRENRETKDGEAPIQLITELARLLSEIFNELGK